MKDVALITGGTSGIGFGIAKSLAKDFDLALSYASNVEKAEKAVTELKEVFPECNVKVYKGVLSSFEGCQELIDNVKSDFETPISVLVNSAGRVRDGLYMSVEFADHAEMINEHVVMPMALSQILIKDMYRKKFGRIINLSSITANRAKKGQVNYATAKAGIEAFTRTLALEVAHRGITVNAIAPGLIETPMTSELISSLKEDKKLLKSKIPAGFIGQIEDIGNLAEYICSEKSRYITGQTFTVDGGRSLGEI